jgi:hypothetical protein
MNIAVHPAVISAKAYAQVCENYIVAETGEAKCLSKSIFKHLCTKHRPDSCISMKFIVIMKSSIPSNLISSDLRPGIARTRFETSNLGGALLIWLAGMVQETNSK